MRSINIFKAIIILLIAQVNLAKAQDFSGEAVFELQLEDTYDADSSTEEQTTLFGRIEVAPELQLPAGFLVDGVIVFEPVKGPDTPGDNSYFENEGVFVEEFKLNYEPNSLSLFAGKFNPAFGTAWDYGRGIWSEDFAEDYEITEKLGLGAAYTYETESSGAYTVSSSAFFADTSFLTDSTITHRERVRKEDGGASNTEDFSSFALALDVEEIAGISGLSYHTAYRYLAEGDADDNGSETGFVFGVGYLIPVSDVLEFDTLAEYTEISNFDGAPEDRQYAYASLIARIYSSWNLAVGYTARNIDQGSGKELRDYLWQISGGYDFGNGLTAELGWRKAEEGGALRDIYGALLRYVVAF